MSQPVPYGAIIYASDYRSLAKFYERVAGLAQREADEEYVLLAAPFFSWLSCRYRSVLLRT